MSPGPRLLVSGRRLLALAACAFLYLELPVAKAQSEIPMFTSSLEFSRD
jgi:hypothetical protein